MSAAGMQQVCNDSDVVLCHARLASLPRPQLPAGQAPQVVSLPPSAMWPAAAAAAARAALDGDGVQEEEPMAFPPVPVMPPGQPQPDTPPDVLAAAQPVDFNRVAAGGRAFTWPGQGGDVAPHSPHMLLYGRKAAVDEMQAVMKEVLHLMVATDLHLEAAMGRNLGNTLSLTGDLGTFGQSVEDMTETFTVPYSLHNTLDVFACMANV